jgi:hypothetical protein
MASGFASRRLLPLALMLATGAMLGACTTARVEQFDRFAETGVAYAAAIDALAEEAIDAAIDADSAVLVRTRDALSESERQQTVLEHDALLKERAALLRDIRRHAALLRNYFVALAALAGSDAPAATAAEAQALAASIDALGARLGAGGLGERAGGVTGAATEIAVARFQREALEKELRLRAPLLERQLELQREAMQVIADELRADLQAVVSQRELADVVEPYASSGSLSRIWTTRRREILAAASAAESADAAASAAEAMQRSFRALVENRYTLADMRAVLADVNAIITLVELVRRLSPD